MTAPLPGPAPPGGSRAVPTIPAGPHRAGALALFDVDPDLIAARVLACPAVAALSAGPLGAAATYLPGRRVAGVRLSPTAVEVHVVARYGPSVAELAAQVRAALAGQVGGRRVDIVVEDLADPVPDASRASGTTAPGEPTPADAPTAGSTVLPALPGASPPAEELAINRPTSGSVVTGGASPSAEEPAVTPPTSRSVLAGRIWRRPQQ